MSHGLRYREAFAQALVALRNLVEASSFPTVHDIDENTTSKELMDAAFEDHKHIIQFNNELIPHLRTLRLMDEIEYPLDPRSERLRHMHKGYFSEAVADLPSYLHSKAKRVTEWIIYNNNPFPDGYGLPGGKSRPSPEQIDKYLERLAPLLPETEIKTFLDQATSDYRMVLEKGKSPGAPERAE